MRSFDNLKEEIREVYRIFDEDEAGNMSMAELARALYTVTGERLPRGALRKLVIGARESLAKRNAEEAAAVDGAAVERSTEVGEDGRPLDAEARSGTSSPIATQSLSPKTSLVARGRAASTASSYANSGRNANHVSAATAEEGIDAVTFEEIVMRKLNSRNRDEEVAYTFALLEDQHYQGFITKESVLRAALEAEEPLTQAELTEMFDALVTGVPTAAIDLVTFRSIQEAALRARDVEALPDGGDVQGAVADTAVDGDSDHTPLAASQLTVTALEAKTEALPQEQQNDRAHL